MFDCPTELDWTLEPLDVLARWPADRRVAMLHSGRFDARWARYTILAQPQCDYRFVTASSDSQHSQTKSAHPKSQTGTSLWQGSTDLLDPAGFKHRATEDLRYLLASGAGLWAGYLGYELGEYFESAAKLRHDHTPVDDRGWPLIDLACCPGWLVYDAHTCRWSAHGSWSPASHTYRNDLPDWWLALPKAEPLASVFAASDLSSVFSRNAYESAVARVMDYISQGDIFQANLTQRFTAKWQGRYPLAQRSAFVKLNQISPAWYGAYIETAPLTQPQADGDHAQQPDMGRVIASTSPELFLSLDERRHIVTRPIKGTRPASVPASELQDSEKDAAELNMIVDLLRNDLGRVCDYGSVRVTQSRTIETHPTIHHGVATVTGDLHPSRDVVDLLRAAMPGGSITGAPKIRAMQIIRELEPVTRGPYCGSIGFLTHDTCCLNIAIRTMLIDPIEQRVDFSVGGGIVADSQPASEYDETITKAQAILQTLNLEAPEA